MKRFLSVLLGLIMVLGFAVTSNAAVVYDNTKEPDKTKVIYKDKYGSTQVIETPTIATVPILTDMQVLPEGVYKKLTEILDEELGFPKYMSVNQDAVLGTLDKDFEGKVTAHGLQPEYLQPLLKKNKADVVVALYIKNIEQSYEPTNDMASIKVNMEMMAVYSWGKKPVQQKYIRNLSVDYGSIATTNWPEQVVADMLREFLAKATNFNKK